MIVCPGCDGQKCGPAFVDGVRDGKSFGELRMMDCHTCHGTGEITEEHAQKIADGKAMRRARIDRGETQREAAAKLGMDVVQYSKLEHGSL